MRQVNLTIFFLLLGMLLLHTACDGPMSDEVIQLPQELKDWVMFPIGSYWVYQDSASGQKDSIVLLSQEIIEHPGSVSGNLAYQSVDQTFWSSLSGNIGARSIPTCEDPVFYIHELSLRGGCAAPIENKDCTVMYSVSEIDTMSINGNLFSSVRIIIENSYPHNIAYWSFGVGRIRLENHSTGQVMNLVNYHINN